MEGMFGGLQGESKVPMRNLVFPLFMFLTTCGSGAVREGAPANGGGTTGSITGSITGSTTSTSGGVLTITPGPSTENFMNPERGFFKWVDPNNDTDLSFVRQAGSSVGYVAFILSDFLSTPISDAYLQSVTAAFQSARTAHIKLLVRFAYNSDGTSDAPKAIMLQHIQQLQPILVANEDVIVALEAGFIGAWGEWHDSTNNLADPNDEYDIMTAILAAVPSDRYVMIRTPTQKSENWAGPTTASQAFGTSALARIGHHNDCFLASADDEGTYLNANDRAYIALDTVWVPMGGETCAVDAPLTDCPNAQTELATNHWSLLNADYLTSVYTGWSSQGCLTAVQTNLGYRIALDGITVTSPAHAGQTLSVSGQVTNSGYARLINSRPVYVVLQNGSTRYNYALPGVDARSWAGQGSSTFSASVTLDASIPSGTYTLALWMPDTATSLQPLADYAVQLANANVWDATQGYNVLSTSFVVQ